MLASLAKMKEMPDKIYDRKSRLEAYGIPSVNLPYKSNCHRSQCLIGRFLWKRNGMHFSVFLQRASASENRRKIYNLIGRGHIFVRKLKKSLPYVQHCTLKKGSKKQAPHSSKFRGENECFLQCRFVSLEVCAKLTSCLLFSLEIDNQK